MIRRLLLAACLAAVAVPVAVAHADDPPVYCNVVIVVDGPVGPLGPLGPGTTIIVPCAEDAVIPPLVFDQPATVELAVVPAPAVRLGVSWATRVFGLRA